MSLFAGPEEHSAHPPETWAVVKRGREWFLEPVQGATLDRYRTKREAEEATRTGRWVRLYQKEARWYAGESVPGWRPYAEVCKA